MSVSIPGLYLLDASGKPPVVALTDVPWGGEGEGGGQNGPVENHGSSACFFVRSSSYSRQKGESGLHNSKTAVLEWNVAPPPTKQPWL